MGTTISAKYEVLELLGRGGMSSVYKVKHLILSKTYAIKVMHAHLVTDSNALIRFRQEAAAASSLSHPNIITVHDFDSENNQPYQAIDYLEGTSLSDEIRRVGSIPPERALHIFLQTASALSHAHAKGVIHRDLKPSNIMLISKDGDTDFVKIVDFGIAKMLPQEGETVQQLTQTGEVFGSPLYMSPEQCSGQRLDSRSDIYSMGCLMYETLTGHPPLAGMSVFETIQKHLEETPKSLKEELPASKLIDGLDGIVLKALAKQPAQRQQSMTELYDNLQQVQKGVSANMMTSMKRKVDLVAIRLQPVVKRLPVKLLVSAFVTTLLSLVLVTWMTQVLLAGNIPKYSSLDWPRFLPEASLRATAGKNNQTMATTQLLLEGLRNLVAENPMPEEGAIGYISLAEAYAKNGNTDDGAREAENLKKHLDALPPGTDVFSLFKAGSSRIDAVQTLSFIGDACYSQGNSKLAAYFYDLARNQLEGESRYAKKRLSMKEADALLLSNDIEGADELFRQTADVNPGQHYSPEFFEIDPTDMFCIDRAIWLSKVGDVLSIKHQWGQAALAYSGAAAEWQKDKSLPFAGQAYYRLASAYKELNNLPAAEVALRKARDAFKGSTNSTAKTNLPAVCQDLADVLYREHSYWDSLQEANEAHSFARELDKH